MEYNIHQITLEVTRNCNLICKNYCMRGQSQQVNLSKEYVDLLLEMINRPGINVQRLLFSGGEPTLNEDLIEYVIDRIIKENLPVRDIYMLTNGHILSAKVIEAFERFNLYQKEKNKEEMENVIKFYEAFYGKTNNSMLFDIEEELNFAHIGISIDPHHKELTVKQLNDYADACKNIHFAVKNEPHDTIKTGLATTEEEYKYEVYPINILFGDDDVIIRNSFYLTATGFITTNGDGAYCDMDLINLGHIKNTDLIGLIQMQVDKILEDIEDNPILYI